MGLESDETVGAGGEVEGALAGGVGVLEGEVGGGVDGVGGSGAPGEREGVWNGLGLVGLAVLWGGSFLFMRVAAPEFGAVPLIGLRVLIGAVMMGGILWVRGGGVGGSGGGVAGVEGDGRGGLGGGGGAVGGALGGSLEGTRGGGGGAVLGRVVHGVWGGRLGGAWWGGGRFWPLVVTGVFNSAVPFCLLATATLSLTAGFASILNATSPFFAALVAWVWLGERLSVSRAVGLVVGFVGVLVLVWGRASFKAGGSGWAIGAGLLASLSYGFAANYSRRALKGMRPLAIGAGSLAAAAVVLGPFVVWLWPGRMPSMRAWGALVMLAVLSTGVAYLIYFRLLERMGAARTVSVTFLIPIFAMGLGWIFLGERVTWRMVVGAGVVILGTGMASGGKIRMTKPETRSKSE